MADKDITDKDIADTLRAAGIDMPKGMERPRALSSPEDLADTLRAAGISAIVSNNGVSFKDDGFDDTPESRAAMRTRQSVKRTTPAKGPGFSADKIDPDPETKGLSERLGLTNQFISGVPIAGPMAKLAGAAGGAAFQAGEKGEGGIDTTFGQRYDRNVKMIDDATKYYAQENPFSSTMANVGGAVAGTTPFAMTRLGGAMLGTYGPTVGSRMWTGGLGGAGIGGADAALRGDNVLHGMMIGAGGGVAGPIIGEGARGATNLATSYLWPRTGVLRDYNTGSINRLTAALEGESAGSLAAGRERMGSAGFLGDINQGMTDVAGGLSHTVGPQKGIVREAYRVRDAAARDRIDKAVTDAAGPPVNTVTFSKMTTEARKKAADPLYEQFRNTVIPPNEKLAAMVPRLEEAGAFKMADRLSKITGEPINLKFLGPDGAKEAFPSAQTWDYVKRGLDAQIDAAYTAGNKTEARALVNLKNDMLKEIHNSPGGDVYKKARQTFADHSELLDQVAAGRDTFLGGRAGLSADELREELKGLTGPALKARMIGMRAVIKDTMGATFNGDTTMRNQLLAPNNIEKLELMLGKNEASKLIKSMNSEKFLKEQSQNVVHGTQTTPRAEQVKALEMHQLPAWDVNLTQPMSFIPPRMREALRPTTVLDAWRGQRHGEMYNQLVNAVTSSGPKMEELITALLTEQARRAAGSNVSNKLGKLMTGAITGPGSAIGRRALRDDQRSNR